MPVLLAPPPRTVANDPMPSGWAVPAAAKVGIESVPSSTATWPVKVLLPESTSVPGPAFVRPLALAKLIVVGVPAVAAALKVIWKTLLPLASIDLI